MSNSRADMTGQRFGLLLVVKEAGSNPAGKALWLCSCDCGADKVMRGDSLRSGVSRSCGCGPGENRKHGMHGTRVYKTWTSVVRRATKPKAHNYANYGGRGITLHPSWLKFENFLADMGEPKANESIDRIDPDGPYCPSNCRWASDAEQRRNQRRNVRLTWQGRTLVVADWADLVGLHRNVLYQRHAAGWETERTLTTGVTPARLAEALAATSP